MVNALSAAPSLVLSKDSKDSDHGNVQPEPAKLNTMTDVPVQPIPLDEAVQKVTKLPDEIRVMLSKKHRAKRSATAKASNLRKAKEMFGKDVAVDTPSGYPMLDNVLKVLNELYAETVTSADLETDSCELFDTETRRQIESNTESRVDLADQINTAAGDKATALGIQEESAKRIADFSKELEELNHECMMQVGPCPLGEVGEDPPPCEYGPAGIIGEQVRVTASHFEIAGNVSDKVNCDAPALMQVPSLMQCYMQNDRSHFKLATGNGTAMFKSKAAFLAVQRMAKLLANKEDPEREAALEGGDTSSDEMATRAEAEELLKSVSLDDIPTTCKPAGATVEVGDKCYILRDAIDQMVGEIDYVLQESRIKQTAKEEECRSSIKNLNEQIATYTKAESDAGIALIAATSREGVAQNELRLQVTQFQDVSKALVTGISECNAKFKKFHEERCGLNSIRDELYRIEGGNPFIVDCAVSAWEPATACTATCGGGTQMLTRGITMDPIYGAECPPLMKTAPCAENDCPVDCKLSDWEGWSACSKDCGSGVMSRNRQVEVQASNDGTACEATVEIVPCNGVKCDADCLLGEWSPWSLCSKECGSGMRTRKKKETTKARGNGVCSDEFETDPDAPGGGARAEMDTCNPTPCADNLSCKAALDVMLVLDGSGSVGSGGFAQTKNFAKKMLARMQYGSESTPELGVKAGVVQFSGDGHLYGPSPKIESELTYDRAKLNQAINDMTFMQRATFTDLGMRLALAELNRNGRNTASSVLFVLTDGRPTFELNALDAASEVRTQDNTRLVFVGVGGNIAPEDWTLMQDMATFPHQVNVLRATNYDTLQQQVGELLADICPDVGGDEQLWDMDRLTVDGQGKGYLGFQRKTQTGSSCIDWGSSGIDHWNAAQFPGAGLTENFCRNPDGDRTIWCWTAAGYATGWDWGFCDPCADGECS